MSNPRSSKRKKTSANARDNAVQGAVLAHPPITEALIDFRVRFADGTPHVVIEQAFEAANLGYYRKAPIMRSQFSIHVAPAEQADTLQSEKSVIGSRWHSSDEHFVAQLTVEGMTVSRLAPYHSWQELLDETQRVWNVFYRSASLTSVQRVATRYINNLQLPLQPGESFDRYVRVLPNFPSPMPRSIQQFLQRHVLVDDVQGTTVALTLALESLRPGQSVPLILDIDAFKACALTGDQFEEMWGQLRTLHELKNRCFFNALTQEALALYQ